MPNLKPRASLGRRRITLPTHCALTVLLLAGVAAAQVPDLERETPDLQARRAEHSQRKFGSSAEARVKACEQVRSMHPVSFEAPPGTRTLQAPADHCLNI